MQRYCQGDVTMIQYKYKEVGDMSYKNCKKCGETFPLTEQFFQKRKDSKDGYRSECKECRNKYQAKYKKENHEKIIKMNKAYNQENRDKRIQYKKENKTRLREYDKLYRKENLEKEKAFRIKYRKENPELYRVARMRYRSRKNKLPQTLTVEEWENCLNHFDNCCAYCGKHQMELENKIEQDHFIPVTKQGGYTVGNIVPACRSCNASKLDSDFEEWYINQSFYNKNAEQKIIKYIEVMKGALV